MDFQTNPTKQSSSFAGAAASLDVSRLDKTHALTTKKRDDVLLGGLCPADQLYLNSLMEDNSSEADEEVVRSSAWSPMIHSPVITNKRIKKLKPTYAITLSLEDISYIRPSWGMSKGLKTIKKKDPKKLMDEKQQKLGLRDNSDTKGSHETTYRWFLVLLTIVVILLTVPTYLSNRKKEYDNSVSTRLYINPKTRVLEFYREGSELLNPILRLNFGESIPSELKPDECTCEIYAAESERTNSKSEVEDKKSCFSCLDWAYRANLRVYADKKNFDNISYCYDIKWQSYDTLQTPIIDCFDVKDEQWFGIGDVHWPAWQLNKHQFRPSPLFSNLSYEFATNEERNDAASHLVLGSYVNLSLFTSNGIHIIGMRSDFQVSLSMTQDSKLGTRKMCLSASCTDKCTQAWSRIDRLDELRYQNNFLEYRVCSSASLRNLISKQISAKTRWTQIETVANKSIHVNSDVILVKDNGNAPQMLSKLIERESASTKILGDDSIKVENSSLDKEFSIIHERGLPESIGLIERTIFATSPEFLPVLDGQTVRQFVDDIVMLGLKASPILSIDARWETHVGSLELNTALFPKAKLLFEILHNKGFKIILTIKPYIDTTVGSSIINQLFDNKRLYSANFRKGIHVWPSHGSTYRKVADQGQTGTIIRRKSLFSHVNESIETGQKDSVKIPYICRCKESSEGYCALIDLTQVQNRIWLADNISKSTLLTRDADGIQLGGLQPLGPQWDDHYRAGVSELAKNLLIKHKIYTIPQWTGDFGYIQLAPRKFSWDGLRSIIGSVLNLEMIGFSLVHPGSVWGDLRSNSALKTSKTTQDRLNIIYGVDRMESSDKSDEELAVRWLQVSIFMPILQFSNIAPIKRYELQELLQNLTRIRRNHVVPELKKNLPPTPLISRSALKNNTAATSKNPLPLMRPVWLTDDTAETIVPEQFAIGPDLLVAPILSEGVRQRDIYLPSGVWRDELRQINLRGGKWLRNYPIELNEISWFTRAKR